jgi:hypothetical protein
LIRKIHAEFPPAKKHIYLEDMLAAMFVKFAGRWT